MLGLISRARPVHRGPRPDPVVIDDNVGYGSTLRAARALVEQLGGRAVTRSVESAWTLYHRSGGTTSPTLQTCRPTDPRPNLHHSIHKRLTGHLLRGDTGACLRAGALTLRRGLEALDLCSPQVRNYARFPKLGQPAFELPPRGDAVGSR
ncbi:hypothetical protein EES45_33875 [Streptomyces sp. ADI97-07]|nr:hypothetical protein EES45_33875 [Streptomyces sp. ADI97-07]